MKGDRIIIPEALRNNILTALHTGHQGETKTILLARESVYWPGINNDIRKLVQSCTTCVKYQNAQPKMPIQQPDLPTTAWQKLGSDIFEYKGEKYLLIVDYYSRYPIIRKLENITARTVSTKFTSVILEFGIPKIIIADFGTQYTSEDFRSRCKALNIELKFSSPHHHQANSVAERTVGTIKRLWKKADECKQCKGTAVWMYRTTPLDSNLPSPYEMLYGRRPTTCLPCTQHSNNEYAEFQQRKQSDQARFYDRKNNTDVRSLIPNEPVSVYNTLTRSWEPGHVIKQTDQRTYLVSKGDRDLYRTREHIKPRSALVPPMVYDSNTNVIPRQTVGPRQQQAPPKSAPKQDTTALPAKTLDNQPSAVVNSSPMRTRSGRIVTVPARYKD